MQKCDCTSHTQKGAARTHIPHTFQNGFRTQTHDRTSQLIPWISIRNPGSALNWRNFEKRPKNFVVFQFFQNYFNFGWILANQLNRFICKFFLWFFWHPWGSWGRLISGVIKVYFTSYICKICYDQILIGLESRKPAIVPGQKSKNNFVWCLIQMRTRKFAFILL